jgi:hypothetical protein
MKIDFVNDVMLSEHLEESKSNLFIYFHDNYAHVAISTPPSVASLSTQTCKGNLTDSRRELHLSLAKENPK